MRILRNGQRKARMRLQQQWAFNVSDIQTWFLFMLSFKWTSAACLQEITYVFYSVHGHCLSWYISKFPNDCVRYKNAVLLYCELQRYGFYSRVNYCNSTYGIVYMYRSKKVQISLERPQKTRRYLHWSLSCNHHTAKTATRPLQKRIWFQTCISVYKALHLKSADIQFSFLTTRFKKYCNSYWLYYSWISNPNSSKLLATGRSPDRSKFGEGLAS